MPWNASLLRTTVCGWRSAVRHWLMGKDPDLLEVMGLWLLILAVRGCLKSSLFILTIMEICESDSEELIIMRSGTYPKYLFFSGLLMLHWSCLSVDENIQCSSLLSCWPSGLLLGRKALPGTPDPSLSSTHLGQWRPTADSLWSCSLCWYFLLRKMGCTENNSSYLFPFKGHV